jgi:hypothetical protein
MKFGIADKVEKGGVSIMRPGRYRRVFVLPEMPYNAETRRKTGLGKLLNPSVHYSGFDMKLLE